MLLSAVPLGMITLGLVLSVQAWTGSLAPPALLLLAATATIAVRRAPAPAR